MQAKQIVDLFWENYMKWQTFITNYILGVQFNLFTLHNYSLFYFAIINGGPQPIM